MFNLGSLIYTLALDDAKFKTELEKSSKELDKFAKDCEKIGKTLTLSLTAPLVLAGGAAIKLAGDLEVAGKKFDKAFAGVGAKAQKELGKLTDEFGFSNLEATKLLGNTADLLKGFGATSGQALDTATKVQQLAAALSAYNGIPVEEASQKITKALLGETEGLKDLGIAISADAVQSELLRLGQDKLTGTALNLAKSQVVLRLATEQSGDAVGAFADNQNTLNFQMNKVQGQLMDLGAGFGEVLMPAVKSALSGVSDLIKYFTDMGPATKGLIVGLGGIAAIAGPFVLAMGKINTSVLTLANSLKTFLITNPWLLAIAGLGALGVAIAGAVDEQAKNEEATLRLTETYKELYGDIETLIDANGRIVKSLPTTEIGKLAGAFKQLGGDSTLAGDALKYLADQVQANKQAQLDAKTAEVQALESKLNLARASLTMAQNSRAELVANKNLLEVQGKLTEGTKARFNQLMADSDKAIAKANESIKSEEARLKGTTEYNIAIQQQLTLKKELNGEAEKERKASEDKAKTDKAAKDAANATIASSKKFIDARDKINEDYKTQLDLINTKEKEGRANNKESSEERIKLLEKTLGAYNNDLDVSLEKANNAEFAKANPNTAKFYIDFFNTLITEQTKLNSLNKDVIDKETVKKSFELVEKFQTKLLELGTDFSTVTDKDKEFFSNLNDRFYETDFVENLLNKKLEYLVWVKEGADKLVASLESTNVSLIGSAEDRIEIQRQKEQELSTWITYYQDAGVFSAEKAENLKIKLAEKGVNDRIKIYESEYTEFNQIANRFLGNISSTANALSTIGTNVIQAELNTSLTALDEKYNKQINNLESLSKATYETQIADANAKILIDKAMADETAKIQEEANQSALDAEADHLAEETSLREEYSGKQLATKLADLDKAYLEEINSSKLATDRQIRDLDKVSIANKAVSDEETRINEKKAKDEEKITKDAAQRQYDIQLEGWKWSQALSLAQAIANAPLLVLNALTGTAIYGPIISGIAGVAAGAAGIAQIAAIASTPPPVKPKLYDGGIITPTVGGRNVTIGEAGSPEAVMPLNDAFFNRLADAATGANYGSLSNNSSRGNTTIPIYLDGKMITEVVVDNINNRQSFIQSSSIV